MKNILKHDHIAYPESGIWNPVSCRMMLSVILLCSLSFSSRAQDVEPYPSADRILADVRAAFPRERVEMSGELQTLGDDGNVAVEYGVELALHWMADQPAAELKLYDAFGAPLATCSIRYTDARQGMAEYVFSGTGDGTHPPSVDETIGETVLTWRDLSLEFLWWTNGFYSGENSKKGRPCYILDVPAPEAVSGAHSARLWIDREVRALLSAEFFDAEHRSIKKIDVKSFKKVDDLWTLQKLEVVVYPSRRKTILRIRDLHAF